ncbi:MAG: L-2-hydroxyglutarate oxidase [Planctomycetota bacterium]|nr:MAG: L-2-hydroxyglutarate oxidase [Planctomycetota bacterium]
MKPVACDFAVIGGGIVGLASAWRLTQAFPGARVHVLEKEPKLAAHQSGRNSGVLHSGIYYKPGSLKAQTCRAGRAAMVEFCQQHEIRHEVCGKVIVAVDDSEVPRLEGIYERGVQNQVRCEIIDVDQLQSLEPHAAGVAAIHVPDAGIADYPAVCEKLAELIRRAGGTIHLNQGVEKIQANDTCVRLTTATQIYECDFLVACAGLYSDKLVRLSGLEPPAKIVPFRGEYYELIPERRYLCRNLIYPVPDPQFPFLGVHFTRMVTGQVECGPNAVFALAREGYSWTAIQPLELLESLSYSGFQKLALRHWKMGVGEVVRSLSKQAFVRALQRLIPEIRAGDLVPCRSGVRAQALGKDGSLIDDFLWVTGPRMLHVCNAPSPAATASLEIGRLIAERVQRELGTAVSDRTDDG